MGSLVGGIHAIVRLSDVAVIICKTPQTWYTRQALDAKCTNEEDVRARKSTSALNGLPLLWTARMASRPLRSGASTAI